MKGTLGNTEQETEFARELGKDVKEECKQYADRPDRKYELAGKDGGKRKMQRARSYIKVLGMNAAFSS